MLKRILVPLVLACALLALAGCTGQTAQEGADSTSVSSGGNDAASSSDGSTAASEASDGKSIVVYFSATGTTEGVAERIAAATGSDLYEIIPADPYTTEDLNYNDNLSRTSVEMADESARPAIGSDPMDPSGYSTVYLGYPIWWGEAPRIMSTFVESTDLSGMTIVPFCTSGGSSIGDSAKTLEQQAGTGIWTPGGRLSGSASDDDIAAFVERNR